jgi:hypothetical protein
MDKVLELATRRGLALADRDRDAVTAQLHPRFVYVDANGRRRDRDDYLAFVTDGPVRWNAQTLEDVQVVGNASVGVLVARVVDDVIYDGKPARWQFTTTQTYVEEHGSWFYLAGHTALPAS